MHGRHHLGSVPSTHSMHNTQVGSSLSFFGDQGPCSYPGKASACVASQAASSGQRVQDRGSGSGFPGGRLQPVLMRHPPPSYLSKLGGGGGGGWGGVQPGVGGGGFPAGGRGGGSSRGSGGGSSQGSGGCLAGGQGGCLAGGQGGGVWPGVRGGGVWVMVKVRVTELVEPVLVL